MSHATKNALPIRQIVLCNQKDTAKLVKMTRSEDRIVRITSGTETFYCSWHDFVWLEGKFEKEEEFGFKPLVGVTDCHQGAVRKLFNYDEFRGQTTVAQDKWLLARLPIRTIADLELVPAC